jgi:hypothetical protein
MNRPSPASLADAPDDPGPSLVNLDRLPFLESFMEPWYSSSAFPGENATWGSSSSVAIGAHLHLPTVVGLAQSIDHGVSPAVGQQSVCQEAKEAATSQLARILFGTGSRPEE